VADTSDVILEGAGAYKTRVRGVTLTYDEHGIAMPFQHDGRWWRASHTYYETYRDNRREWVVCQEVTAPDAA
jgi:hypothetical protein